MALVRSGQRSASKKIRVNRRPVPVAAPRRSRTMAPRQGGLLWQRKMQSLALRLSKRRGRRHASGAPMKRS